MPDYQALYFMLFAAIADATEYLEQGQPFLATQRLISVQQEAEEEYVSEE